MCYDPSETQSGANLGIVEILGRQKFAVVLLKAITIDFFQSHGKSTSHRDRLKILQILGAKKGRASCITCCGIISGPLAWVLKCATAATTLEI